MPESSTSISSIHAELLKMLRAQSLYLREKSSGGSGHIFEGTKPAMQGRQKVDGFYFAGVMEKPKDVRLYFFPIYTHKDQFRISQELDRFLKGKSCFHIRRLSPDLKNEISDMIRKGVELYREEGLI